MNTKLTGGRRRKWDSSRIVAIEIEDKIETIRIIKKLRLYEMGKLQK